MTEALTFKIEAENGSAFLQVFGEITEDADFAPVFETSFAGLRVDLSEVRRINSCGVREWIEFMRSCDERSIDVTLIKCAPFIVAQLNMISNFSGKQGRVESVYAPYYCDGCGTESTRLIDLTAGKSEIDEEISCPNCSERAEFDDIPETYLQFMED